MEHVLAPSPAERQALDIEDVFAPSRAPREGLGVEQVIVPSRAKREVLEYAPSRAAREVVDDDRRWLLLIVAMFVLSVGLVAVTYHIYHATGPHPQGKLFLRQVKHVARLMLPGLKRY